MARNLLACATLFLVPVIVMAGEQTAPAETVIRLTAQPAAAPRPALRYQLVPELLEMKPGNPIHAYLICFCEQQNFFYDKAAIENRERCLTLPLPELAALKLGDYGRNALRQADYAARLDTPDWQILTKLKMDGVATLLPDVQQMRMIANALKVRFRVEIADKRFDDAITTAKTIFALARHLGEHPTLIGDLVGLAIANIGIGPLEELIEQPGSPNLFWALTNLPEPLIDLRKGLQGERLWFFNEFSQIDETNPMTEDQVKRSKLWSSLKLFDGDVKSPLQTELEKRSKDESYLKSARQQLVSSGGSEEKVAKFDPFQVTILHEKFLFDTERDDGMKWMSLPYWQAEDALLETPDRVRNLSLFGRLLLPALLKVRWAQARLEQRIGLLRHVEAIRLYAAEHDGKLPSQLSDVKLPLPADPVTGKPFIYKAEGETATIRGTPPKDDKNPAFNVRYEVTIRK